MELDRFLKKAAAETDAELDRILPLAAQNPTTIHEAMRYCIFAGGKRLRPALCLAAAEACGGNFEGALAAACAVELLHTYSLVHDDLPCMDDDDLRRGRPTCHKVYGEGMAVLCGDALLTEAFVALSKSSPTALYSTGHKIAELAHAGSSLKLIGGQVMDLEAEGKSITLAELIQIHETKTAALIICSLRLGAMSANADVSQLNAISEFGYALGLAFQVIDDLLDITESTETLGKTAGKDLAVAKATYPSLLGLDGARAEAARLTTQALDALKPLGENGLLLEQIAHSMLRRKF